MAGRAVVVIIYYLYVMKREIQIPRIIKLVLHETKFHRTSVKLFMRKTRKVNKK